MGKLAQCWVLQGDWIFKGEKISGPLLRGGHSESVCVGFVMWNKGLFFGFELMINSMALLLTWS